jgi:hypothetical protein
MKTDGSEGKGVSWRFIAVILIVLILAVPQVFIRGWGAQFSNSVYPLLQVARALAGGNGAIFATTTGLEFGEVPSMLFALMVSGLAYLVPGMGAAGAAAFLSALGWSAAALAFLAVGKAIQRLPGSAVAALLLCFNPIVISSAGSSSSWIVALTWWVMVFLLSRRIILLLIALTALVLLILPLPPGLPIPPTGLQSALAWSLLIFLSGIAAELAARWLSANMKPEVDSQRVFRLALAAILVAASVYQLSKLSDLLQAKPRARWALEADVAAWLKENTEPTAVIGTSEKIGYLANRQALPLESAAASETLQAQLAAQPVDYLVSSAALPWQLLANWRWFQLNYRPLVELDAPYVSDAPYTIWTYQPPPAELGFAQAINARVPNRLRILGYQIDQANLEAANEVISTLYLEAAAHSNEPVAPFVVTTRLLSPLNGEPLAEWDNLLPDSVEPESWGPGERISEQITIDVPAGLEPGAYPLNISLAGPDTAEFWPISLDNDIERLDRLQVGYLVVPTAVDEDVIQERQATFGDQIQLLGYTISEARPGEALELTLFWQVSEPLGNKVPSLIVFTHLLDGNGQLVANHDSVPGNGNYPTPSWMPGMIIADAHTIQMPRDLPPGGYEVRVGLYDPESGERLPVVGGDGEPYADNSFPLAGFSLANSQ